MMGKMGFDATKVAPAQAFEVLPKGWYPCVIDDPENKQGTNGQRLNLVFVVDAGKGKGRKMFEGINWMHTNDDAQRIGQEQLSAICHAVGIKQLESDTQLKGKKLAVKFGVEEARKDEATGKEYEARNVAKGYKTLEGFDFIDPMGTGQTPMGANAPADAPDWMKNPNPDKPSTPDWVGGEQAAPAAPEAPAVPDAAPPPPVQKTDEELLAEGGWTIHPQNPAYWYKGKEVVTKADALAKLAPATPAAPDVPASPPSTPAAAPAPAAATPAPAPAAAPAADGDTPPWLQGQ